MRPTICISIAAMLLGMGIAQAEYLEVQASQVTTISSGDRAASPRALVQWTLPDSLDTKIIDGAAITMTLQRTDDCPLDVAIFPLSRGWSAETAGWEASWNRAGGEYVDSLPSPAIATDRNGGKISAIVYDAVMDQIAGRRPNFGFIVVPDPESTCKLSEISANDIAKLADAKLIIAYRTRR